MKTWQCFAWLAITAIAYYFAGKLILVIAAFIFFIQGWLWFCRRFPRTAWFVYGFIGGLTGRRRYRRW